MRQLPVKQRPVARDPIQANIILFKIRLPAKVRLARQRMIVPTGGHIAVVGQWGEFETGWQVFGKTEAKVSLSAADGLDHIPDAAVNQPDAHLGITRLKAADDFRHKVVGCGGHRRHRHQPGARLADLADIRQHRLDMGQQLLRTFGKILPIQREGHPPGGTFEQPVAQRRLQLFDASAKGRLRQADGFSGQPKTAIFHQGAKGVEIVEVKIYGHGGILIGCLAPSPRPVRGDGG